jgi:hypothetical protein
MMEDMRIMGRRAGLGNTLSREILGIGDDDEMTR